MKCKDVDLIATIDGIANIEMTSHIDGCQKCQKELKQLTSFLNIVSLHYSEGKEMEAEIDRELESMDFDKMKPLPDMIKNKIKDLKEKSLVSQVKKVIGRGKKNVEELVGNLLSPQMEAMPASPKDITKPKKKKKKKS